jgi:NTE family protein
MNAIAHISPREQTAFVLSGGASLGAIQVGMLRALYERGIAPNLIVGTSAGALNAAFIASRSQTPETADELGDVWRSLRFRQLFPLNPLTGLLGFAGTRDHLVPNGGLRRLVEHYSTYDRLEELPIPLHVIATDVLTGREIRLSKGPLVDAVMASAAIPGVLPTVEWEGHTLMDGGVANNAPISQAVSLGATKVYVLPSGPPCDLDEPPRGALGMLVHATAQLVHHQLMADLSALAGTAELVLLPPPCPIKVQPMDFGQASELIEAALDTARAFLDARDASGRPQSRALRRRHSPAHSRQQPLHLKG